MKFACPICCGVLRGGECTQKHLHPAEMVPPINTSGVCLICKMREGQPHDVDKHIKHRARLRLAEQLGKAD